MAVSFRVLYVEAQLSTLLYIFLPFLILMRSKVLGKRLHSACDDTSDTVS